MTQRDRPFRILPLVALSLLVLAPVQAKATSHTTSLTKLCKWIVCQPAPTIAPKIAQADPQITPGMYVLKRAPGSARQRGSSLSRGFGHTRWAMSWPLSKWSS